MEAVGAVSQYKILQCCLTLLHSTLLPTGHPPHVQCSSADLALVCLYQTTINVRKNNSKETIIDTDLKVGNKMVTTYLRFEGHPEGANAITQAKDHVFFELTDTCFKNVLTQGCSPYTLESTFRG